MKKFALIIALTFSVPPIFSQQEKEVQAFQEHLYGESDLEFMKKELPLIVGEEIKVDTAMIAHRLEKIYKEVASIAASDNHNTDVLKKYLSQRFLKLYNEVDYWQIKLGEMIIGVDCWIRLQDWYKLEYKIGSIKVISPSKAIADVIVFDINQTPEEEEIISTSKIRLDLVFENGNWMVDDFADYNKVGELYESDSRLYRKGIDEALEYFQESN